eukprot:GHRR01008323.1.p1 GENE.GHRR01008323.1~~GHRR01008323.1.p1  ORF type:complete len:143 (+),score=54.82 GHRR01008323.1:736-1164(+)
MESAAGGGSDTTGEAGVSQFPAPPSFYKQYQEGPEAGPPPPPPVAGEIFAFAEYFSTEQDYVPPLTTDKLYAVQNGSVDIKQELMELNKGVLFLFLELLTVLVQQPSQYAQALSQVKVALLNMSHLINMARPLQVNCYVSVA